MDVRDSLGDNERFHRLGWRRLWLIARHSLRLWLTAPPSFGAATRRDDREGWSTDRRTAVRCPETTIRFVEGVRSCSRGSS